MRDFIINTIIWTFAFYGIFEFIKNIIYLCSYTKCKVDGIHLIITVKNQEDKIEGFLRSIIFKVFCGKEEYLKNIIIADLKSKDKSKEIAKKLEKDYDMVKVLSWKECKELIDIIDEN